MIWISIKIRSLSKMCAQKNSDAVTQHVCRMVFMSSHFSTHPNSLKLLDFKNIADLFPQSKRSGMGSNNWHLDYINGLTVSWCRISLFNLPYICPSMLIYSGLLSWIIWWIFLKLLNFNTFWSMLLTSPAI